MFDSSGVYFHFLVYLTGALSCLILLGMALIVLYTHLLDVLGWMFNRLLQSKNSFSRKFWVWRACFHYSRFVNLPPPNTEVLSPERRLYNSLTELLLEAEELGFVIKVDTTPMLPLAMGNYRMDGEVYPKFTREPSVEDQNRTSEE